MKKNEEKNGENKDFKLNNLLLGAHMSIVGGFHVSILNAEKIGCTTMQIFTKSNRSYKAKEIKESEAKLFKETLKKSKLKNIVVHSCYLINLATIEKDKLENSINALLTELKRCELLGIELLVLHPGSHMKIGVKEGINQIVKNLDIVLSKFEGKTKIIIETMAGQGTSLGHSFQHIIDIINKSKYKEKLGVCLDTCHVYSAGYDIGKNYEKIMEEFDKIIGLNLLKVIHLNDSKTALKSLVDRHEHIGKGTIPINTFKLIMNDKRLLNIPIILETPNDENYESEIKLLKGFVL